MKLNNEESRCAIETATIDLPDLPNEGSFAAAAADDDYVIFDQSNKETDDDNHGATI